MQQSNKDSILWDKESDKHVERTINTYGKMYGTKDKEELANKIFDCTTKEIASSNIRLLDIGCSYGQLMFYLNKKFVNSRYVGIDPGHNSINIASENLESNSTKFYQGYSHDLSIFDDNSFDVIVFAMVLQWVPRKYLMKTIQEVDRVLKYNGVIFIEEFLPDLPVMTPSKHNKEVYIFKDFYNEYFDVFPWYEKVYTEIIDNEKGVDYRKAIYLLKKKEFQDGYKQKELDL